MTTTHSFVIPMNHLVRSIALFLVSVCVMLPQAAIAQNDAELNVFPDISFGALDDAAGRPSSWSASYTADGDKGELTVSARLSGRWHVYSVTQEPGGPLPTKISIAKPDSVKLDGKFSPDSPPAKSVSDIYEGLTIEEHSDEVTWTAPLKLPSDFSGDITVTVNALACMTDGSCVPINETLTAKRVEGESKPKTESGDSMPAAATKVPSTISGTPSFSFPASGLPGSNRSGADFLKSMQQQSIATDTNPEIAKLPVFRDDGYQVQWKAWVSTAIAPGQKGTLTLRVIPDDTYHVYAAAVDGSNFSTNFVVTEKNGLQVGKPETDAEIVAKPAIVPGMDPIRYHEGTVTWTLPVTVPGETEPGKFTLQGYVAYMACTDKFCLEPKALQFTAVVNVAAESDTTPSAVELVSAKSATALDEAATIKWVDGAGSDNTPVPTASPESAIEEMAAGGDQDPKSNAAVDDFASADSASEESETPFAAAMKTEADIRSTSPAAATLSDNSKAFSLPVILLMAFGGGLILNLMPCVLPVVGLKVMSFVQQAGEDRKRVFLLNAAYVVGILAVFGVLTALAVLLSFSWGEQFTYFPVRLGLTLLVFALALSYLGVWEIPAPGMAAGKDAQQLQNREGVVGAFFKGAFTTVMATPCSGPLLGFVLGYTISLSPQQTALVIMMVGVGMASPYMALGLFPSLVRLLPKPGDWMVTLKEFLAFLFLGTVAYFFNQFSDGDKLPVFVALIGVWFGCWIIGKVPAWETLEKRLWAWSCGILSAVVVGLLAFNQLSEKQLPSGAISTSGVQYVAGDHVQWERYDPARLKQLQAEGKTVMLDFTAKWCVNCIVNTRVALDTAETKKQLEQLDAVAMLADWTDHDAAIKSKLEELESRSIPLLAIYPGSTPEEPIILRDLVSQSRVLTALEAAGPSVNKVARKAK